VFVDKKFSVYLLWVALLFSSELMADDEMVVSTFRPAPKEQLATSITVLDSQVISEVAVQHFEELIALVPNMNYSGDGNRARYIQLRGIGELEQYEGAPNPSVGFIIDDIDLSGLGSAATLFDTDQVEVLRGPQGTRFGANALAGLVYVKSADPTETFESRVEVVGATESTYSLGGVVSGPLTERLLNRTSVQYFSSDGFQRNVFLGKDDTNGQDELTARTKFRFDLNDDWRFDLTGLYAHIDDGYDAFAVDNNGSRTFSDKPGQDKQKTAAGSLRVTGDFDDAVTLISITSLAHTDSTFSFDADWGNDDFWNTPEFGNSVYDYFSETDRTRETQSQEFRLISGDAAKLFGVADWLVGIYGMKLDEDIDVVDFGRDDFGCVTPCIFPFASGYDSKTAAVFGEVGIPLSEKWRLDVGMRWEYWDADYRDISAVSFSPDDSLWGGHFNLGYRSSEQTLWYGRIARGYKAGGFNLDPNVQPEDVEYDAENDWNYELGMKYLSPDARVQLDVVAFWVVREDMQVKVPTQDVIGDPIAFSFLTTNADEGWNRGIEASANWQLTEAWSLFGSLGLLDTEIRDFDYDRDLEGRGQAHAPDYTFAVGAAWRNGQGWFARADVTGKDDFYYDYSHDEKSKSYELVNLRLGREWDRWSVMLWGNNIFDKNYYVRGFFFGNEPPNFPEKLYTQQGDQRQVGVTVNWMFE